MKKLRNKNKSGFTLIELLVVIAIIGLLASVVLLALNSARAKSRDAKRLADVRQIASALELYFNDNNSYPTGTNSVGTAAQPANTMVFGSASTVTNPVALTPTYIGLVPSAPAPQDGSCTASAAGGNTYLYEVNSAGSFYTFSFCLGAVTGGYSAGTRTLTPAGIQ